MNDDNTCWLTRDDEARIVAALGRKRLAYRSIPEAIEVLVAAVETGRPTLTEYWRQRALAAENIEELG